jgi:chorismate dehydratase
MLRIGCVKYLNARPLIRGWPGNVEFDHPSALCQRLANRELDLALVSSFEYLRNPVYRIIDDVSVSSDGPVYSVVLAHCDDIAKIDEIELDPASETSANLLRCLLADLGLKPRLVRNIGLQPVRRAGLQPAVAAAVQPTELQTAENISAGRAGRMPAFQRLHRARLLIGDQAIHFRQKHAGKFEFWDLGEQWKKLTGLPFVYALWLIRPEVSDAESIAQCLRQLRDENLATLDDLIEEVATDVGTSAIPSANLNSPIPQKEFNRQFLLRYFRMHLRFSFGEKEKQGLRCFADLCAEHGVLPARDRSFKVA